MASRGHFDSSTQQTNNSVIQSCLFQNKITFISMCCCDHLTPKRLVTCDQRSNRGVLTWSSSSMCESYPMHLKSYHAHSCSSFQSYTPPTGQTPNKYERGTRNPSLAKQHPLTQTTTRQRGSKRGPLGFKVSPVCGGRMKLVVIVAKPPHHINLQAREYPSPVPCNPTGSNSIPHLFNVECAGPVSCVFRALFNYLSVLLGISEPSRFSEVAKPSLVTRSCKSGLCYIESGFARRHLV